LSNLFCGACARKRWIVIRKIDNRSAHVYINVSAINLLIIHYTAALNTFIYISLKLILFTIPLNLSINSVFFFFYLWHVLRFFLLFRYYLTFFFQFRVLWRTVKNDNAVFNNYNETWFFYFFYKIHMLTYIFRSTFIFLTVAAPSNDPTNNPAIFIVNAFVPLCKRNSIIFCICNGAIYHWTLYLCHNW